jgi:phage baseplate assembly protein W
MSEDSFLGRGLSFPVSTDETGAITYAAGETDIDQSIRIILGTAPGERVMRPQFGCGIHERVFASLDSTTRSLIKDDVRDALLEWEPRIDVESVSVSDARDQEGALLIEIDYLVVSTNTADNLVYPFYLEEG